MLFFARPKIPIPSVPPLSPPVKRRRRFSLPQWYTIDKRPQAGELEGYLVEEYKRCGKQGCRCRTGAPEGLHGPYYSRRYRDEQGKSRRVYVKREDVEAVRAAIEKRKRRLGEAREARSRHMRRGPYSWKAKGLWPALHEAERVRLNADHDGAAVLGYKHTKIGEPERLSDEDIGGPS